jgi:hypothetical protein
MATGRDGGYPAAAVRRQNGVVQRLSDVQRRREVLDLPKDEAVRNHQCFGGGKPCACAPQLHLGCPAVGQRRALFKVHDGAWARQMGYVVAEGTDE